MIIRKWALVKPNGDSILLEDAIFNPYLKDKADMVDCYNAINNTHHTVKDMTVKFIDG